MVKRIDKEVLAGFIDEARSYLPIILQRIDEFQTGTNQLMAMEEAHRYSHTIKGAASMIGLTGLSHIAYFLEETLEELASGKLVMSKQATTQLRRMVLQIEGYLDGLLSGKLCEQPLLAEATQIYRRMRGLPEEEDKAAVDEALEKRTNASSLATDVRKQSMPSQVVEKSSHEEISPELLDAFSMEAEDHMRNISTLLTNLDRQPEDKEDLQEVRRSVHTLKGAAGAVGLHNIAQLSHRMEDLLDRLFDDSMTIDAEIMDLLFSSSDALEDLVTGEVEDEALQSILNNLYTRYASLLSDQMIEDIVPKLELLGEEAILDLTKLPPLTKKGTKPDEPETVVSPAIRSLKKLVRVPLERMDELVKLVSELVISRSAFELRMNDLVREVEELQLSSERLRRVSSNMETKYEVSALGGKMGLFGGTSVRNPKLELAMADTRDFDDLQLDRYTEFHLLSRELTETTSDIRTVGIELANLIGDFDGILNRHRRLSSQIQDELMRTRMVPLATLANRLHRTVRVLAREQGKLVDLVIEGEDVELDTTVLDAIVDPLLHLLRNAVDHGIEPPELRQVMGKPDRGRINLRAYIEGNQVVIQVGDDGAGLDPQLIRAAAVSKGYISEAEAPELSEEALYTLVFMPGFTTAGEVSKVSGRGVGLDVVRTNVEKLKGMVAVDSIPSQNTTYTIRLPMTLAVTRALLVRASNETFAIPLGAVTQILRLERDKIERVGQEQVIRVEDQVYPLYRLGEVLKLEQPTDETVMRLPVLILKAGAEQVGLVVDQLLTGRDIVIKTLGTHLRRVHGITGATLMGDGSVVLILNPAELIVEAPRVETRVRALDRPVPASVDETLTIMIVDDSLSVRRVVSNLIKSAGWQPVAAKDGIEALEMMQLYARQPDLILIDIEMPRMDGYELMSTLKAHQAYKDIPLVVLTSRAGSKHRQKALEIGAAEYIVKPYQDKVMLNIIRHLVRQSKSVVAA
jgi:chemosensory pili system protein ChpA (sensor histidine kinase/response regulator)